MSANTPKRRSLVTKSDMEVRPAIPGRLVRIKPFKAAAPDDTVSTIRSRLASLGMLFVEEAIRGEEGSFSYAFGLWTRFGVSPFSRQWVKAERIPTPRPAPMGR